jgi:hypothetical protein
MALSYTEYQMAQQDLMTLQSREASQQISIIQAYKERDAALAAGDQAAADRAIAKAATREENLEFTRQDIAKTQATINEFNGTPTVKPASTVATEQKYANPANIVSNSGPVEDDSEAPKVTMDPLGERSVPGVPPGAEKVSQQKAQVIFQDANGNSEPEDMRVRILVPPKYITPELSGPNDELAKAGGIIFPYTPTISFDAKSDYAASQPLHSNFAINFYQRSSIGSISISGKFSVASADDADIYICTMHLLKSLTRMRSGGLGGDPDSGAPPPVCRLYGHGDMMLSNVPVAISNFRLELPDNVDYFTLKSKIFGTTAVPTLSTFSITCIPMYSRAEMLRFSVTDYNSNFNKKGYI